jgi:hypothetical protein
VFEQEVRRQGGLFLKYNTEHLINSCSPVEVVMCLNRRSGGEEVCFEVQHRTPPQLLLSC